MTAGLTWQLLLRATPEQVFTALTRAARADDRVRECHEDDRWLLFSGMPGGPGERTRLCGYVREHAQGSLLQFGPPDGQVHRPASARSETGEAAEVAEAASIGRLVHRMRGFLSELPERVPAP